MCQLAKLTDKKSPKLKTINSIHILILGQENFSGTIVHPQKWTPEHDRIVAGKRVALIGSGATAVTIFPGIKVHKHKNKGSAII